MVESPRIEIPDNTLIIADQEVELLPPDFST